jgi:hypothetical protein
VYHGASGEYGAVLDPSKDPMDVRTITKEEAMQRAKAKGKGIQSV